VKNVFHADRQVDGLQGHFANIFCMLTQIFELMNPYTKSLSCYLQDFVSNSSTFCLFFFIYFRRRVNFFKETKFFVSYNALI